MWKTSHSFSKKNMVGDDESNKLFGFVFALVIVNNFWTCKNTVYTFYEFLLAAQVKIESLTNMNEPISRKANN